MPELAELQAWLQGAILDGRAEAAPHVRSSNRLTAEARIGVYARGYRLRLLDALKGEFPVLAALVGPLVFEMFARGYIAARPPRSYTLYDLGAGFADYLEAARPPDHGALADAPAALARIERARAEVHRARGIERREPAADADGPFVLSLAARGRPGALSRPDSVRLLALPLDFTETLAAFERHNPPPLPVATPSWLAVARARWRVDCHALEAWQFDWLSGLPGGDDDGPGKTTKPDARLAAWLPVALDRGLVVRE